VAALLRRELDLYMTEPTHPQSYNAIRDLVDVFGGVFFQFLWEFHFGPNGWNLMATAAKLEAGRKEKSPSRELGGLGWGFLIVETKTHPVIVDITIAVELGSFSSGKD
jgi:hypothetical protein